jgi:LysM repeat protein
MQKDLKIGLILGLAAVSVAGLWLATRPSLTPQARLLAGDNDAPEKESVAPPAVSNSAPEADNTRSRDNRDTTAPRAPIRRAVSEGSVERHRMAMPAVHVQAETISPERFHIVRKNETLSEISYNYYGSAGKWRKIFEANPRTIKDANVVRAGTKLIIPN